MNRQVAKAAKAAKNVEPEQRAQNSRALRQGTSRVRAACVTAIHVALSFDFAGRTASAAEDQWGVSGGGGVAFLSDADPGPQLSVGGSYGLSDYFEANALASFSQHGDSLSNRVAGLGLGAGARFDVIEWVPFASLRGGVLHVSREGGNDSVGPSLSLSYGLDYLWSRSWAIGISGEHIAFARDGLSLPYHAVRLSLTYRPVF